MPTEREKMLSGELFDARDPELLQATHRARALLVQYNSSVSDDVANRTRLLWELFASCGDGVWIEPQFFCEFGDQISIGAHTFVNANCVFLDSARITIGANALFGPAVQLLTTYHPVAVHERVVRNPEPGHSPFRKEARPIHVGNNTWIGAGALVMPGVTIGDGSTIGAGSVVTHDVPANVLALGNPCRVQRRL